MDRSQINWNSIGFGYDPFWFQRLLETHREKDVERIMRQNQGRKVNGHPVVLIEEPKGEKGICPNCGSNAFFNIWARQHNAQCVDCGTEFRVVFEFGVPMGKVVE